MAKVARSLPILMVVICMSAMTTLLTLIQHPAQVIHTANSPRLSHTPPAAPSAFPRSEVGRGLNAATVPASLMYQGIRRAALRGLPRPATMEAGVVRVLHWASAAQDTSWVNGLPMEAIQDLYPLACNGMAAPTSSQLQEVLNALVLAGRVRAMNSTRIFIGPHFAQWLVYRLVWKPSPLAELVLHATRQPPVVVNLGAGHYWEVEDADADPTYKLLQEHPGGASLLVEANAESLSKTVARLEAGGARGITGRNSRITPNNIVGILKDADVPRQPDLLKVDIDSFDFAVVDAVLQAGYAPALIAVEVNPDFPPPLRFLVEYSDRLRIASGMAGFFGCSTAAWGQMGRQHGYALLQGDTLFSSHDVVLLRLDLLPQFERQYNIAHDALTAFRMMELAGNTGAHWTDPSPLSFMRQAEEWGGALRQLPIWYEQMHVRALIHNDGAAAGPFSLSVDTAPPDALALVEGWQQLFDPLPSPKNAPRTPSQQAPPFPTLQVAFPDGRTRTVSNSEPSQAAFWKGFLTWDGHDGVFHVFEHYLGSGRYDAYMGFGEWIGPTVLLAAPHVRRAFALEPDPICHRQLHESVMANPDIAATTLVSRLCIAPKAGNQTLMGEGGSGSWLQGVTSDSTRLWEKKVRAWSVECVTLPSFMKGHLMEPAKTFLKMDIEGAEWQLIPALYEWLRMLGAGKKPTMLISFHTIDKKQEALEGVLRTLHMFTYGAIIKSKKDVRGHEEDAMNRSQQDLPIRADAKALSTAMLMEQDYFDVLVVDSEA